MKSTGLAAVIGLTLAACGGGAQSSKTAQDANCPPGQTFDGTYCQVDQTAPTQEVAVAPAPQEKPEQPVNEEPVSETPTEDATTEPPVTEEPVAAEEVVLAPEKSTAAAVDYAMAAQAGPVMQYFASSHLPAGARQLGAPFAGQFAQGQVLMRKVQLTAGTCYTVVGMGLPPITEVDLQLFDDATKQLILQDETTGPQAVLGSRDDCYRPTTSGPVQLVITVKAGQGVAAAQVFQK